ncbi:MAG: hypothetical protein JO300_06580, partial [Silvibacterium sp.]|nr:hypothetical protein [Silvibacterium sp.]
MSEMEGFHLERLFPRFAPPACTILLIALCGGAAAQEPSLGSPTSNPAQSLPEEPVPPNHPPLAPNGAPEESNAVPLVRQIIQDQSDDQENPAFFNRHLIAGRFWLSGQS